MCSELQDFDLRCRGAFHLAESWQASPDLKVVWAIEDILSLYNEILRHVIATYEHHRKTGELPGKLTLGTVIDHLRGFVVHGGNLIRIASEQPASNYEVNGVAELKKRLAVAQEIVNEEGYATDMSFLNFSES